MPLAAELELPSFDHTDATLRGPRYRQAMSALRGHDGWLAASPFGFIVLDRGAGEFFLRTKAAVFPGLTIADLFQITDGPLREEIVHNVINVNGEDHRRLRNLVNPALAPRAVDRYRPVMRRFLEELLNRVEGDGRVEFIESFAKPYPSLVIAAVMGAPLADAPRLHHWSNLIQRQFDPTSLMTEREQIERAVAEFYAYEDELIAARRRAPEDDLISALIRAEEAGDRLTDDELRNLVLNILVGGVDTSQSQLAHAVRLLAEHPDQWRLLRSDPRGARPGPSAHLWRRHPLLRRGEPGPGRAAGGARLPGRAGVLVDTRRRPRVRDPVGHLRPRAVASETGKEHLTCPTRRSSGSGPAPSAGSPSTARTRSTHGRPSWASSCGRSLSATPPTSP